MNEIHVCFSTDDNYAPYCGVAVKSMLINAAKDDRIHIYILHNHLSLQHIESFKQIETENGCAIDFIKIDIRDFKDMTLPNISYLSLETLFRLVIARIFVEIDKVIYLDCDILIKGSLWELYNIDVEDWPIAMVKDMFGHEPENPYYNAGVLLINCKKWRDDDIEKKLFEFISDNKDMEFPFQDQDFINIVLKDSILELPLNWNFQISLLHMDEQVLSYAASSKSINIIHYITGCKPWHGIYRNKLVDEYYHYASLVPWDIPDHRTRNIGIDGINYYYNQSIFRGFLNKKMLGTHGHVLILTDIGGDMDLKYAALDLGISSVEVRPFCENVLHELKYDYMIVVCKDVLVMDEIMKKHGYHLDRWDYLCIFDLPNKNRY